MVDTGVRDQSNLNWQGGQGPPLNPVMAPLFVDVIGTISTIIIIITISLINHPKKEYRACSNALVATVGSRDASDQLRWTKGSGLRLSLCLWLVSRA